MRRYNQHEPFNIYRFEAETWEHPVHNHTYHEIIFIIAGSGVHNINGNAFKYKRNDIFLLGPEDYHSFKITSRTKYCYIRFIDSFMKDGGHEKNKRWQQTMKLLLHSRFQSRGSIVQNHHDKKKLFNLLSVLIEEYDHHNNDGFEIIRDGIMKTIMTILERNMRKQALPSGHATTSPIENIVAYIRQNIYNSDTLRLDYLCTKFNYAPNYLSIYFKRHTGEPLKQYIINYKIKLIETRLLYSQAALAEIADEFGFTDESHLCKQFKKYTGLSPGDFRKQRKV